MDHNYPQKNKLNVVFKISCLGSKHINKCDLIMTIVEISLEHINYGKFWGTQICIPNKKAVWSVVSGKCLMTMLQGPDQHCHFKDKLLTEQEE